MQAWSRGVSIFDERTQSLGGSMMRETLNWVVLIVLFFLFILFVRPIIGSLGPPVRVNASAISFQPARAMDVDHHSRTELPGLGPASAEVRNLESVEVALFDLTNQARSAAGLATLTWDAELLQTCRKHNQDMLRQGNISHMDRNGQPPAIRIALRHRLLVGRVAENLASIPFPHHGFLEETAADIFRRWRGNLADWQKILNEDHTELGIAVSTLGNQVRVTQTMVARYALLAQPVPKKMFRNASIPFDFQSLREGFENPEFVDWWSLRERRSLSDRQPIAEARLAVPPGWYQPRFFFQNPGQTSSAAGFLVAFGPAIEVVE